MDNKIYEQEDGSIITESELVSIMVSQIEQLFAEAIKIHFGLQKPTSEQQRTINATKKTFEVDDKIGAVMGQSIANIFVDLFDEQFKDIKDIDIHSVDEYFNIDLNENDTFVNPQSVYSDYINRMMKH